MSPQGCGTDPVEEATEFIAILCIRFGIHGNRGFRNDLLKRKTREAVSTTSVFVRDDACC